MYKTNRLHIRTYHDSELEKIVELFSDPVVMKHADGVKTRAQVNRIWTAFREVKSSDPRRLYAVIEENSRKFVGNASINKCVVESGGYEIGFILKQDMWGKGYATEIAKFLVGHCRRDLNLKTVYATVDDDHPDSINVLTKSGFRFLRYEFDSQGRYSLYRNHES